MRRIYLDHNASSPLRPEARDAMTSVLDSGSMNPSSVHCEGRGARAVIESARATLAHHFKTDPEAVIFTSGATEANTLALSPQIIVPGHNSPIAGLVISAIEHPSVLAGGRFSADAVRKIGVSASGVVELDALEVALNNVSGPALVSVMAANNESGVVQPLEEVADIVHRHDGIFHCDAVQALGRIDISALDADLITVSSHKIGGPMGAGALIVKNRKLQISPLIRGGGQERNLRGGTENTLAIAGFERALVAMTDDDLGRVCELRDQFENSVKTIEDIEVVGQEVDRLPNTSLVLAKGVSAETALISLDLKGISVSSGSACSSGKIDTSHVLAAMGIAPNIAQGALRFSFGWDSAKEDVLTVVEALKQTIARARDRQSAA